MTTEVVERGLTKEQVTLEGLAKATLSGVSVDEGLNLVGMTEPVAEDPSRAIAYGAGYSGARETLGRPVGEVIDSSNDNPVADQIDEGSDESDFELSVP